MCHCQLQRGGEPRQQRACCGAGTVVGASDWLCIPTVLSSLLPWPSPSQKQAVIHGIGKPGQQCRPTNDTLLAADGVSGLFFCLVSVDTPRPRWQWCLLGNLDHWVKAQHHMCLAPGVPGPCVYKWRPLLCIFLHSNRRLTCAPYYFFPKGP